MITGTINLNDVLETLPLVTGISATDRVLVEVSGSTGAYRFPITGLISLLGAQGSTGNIGPTGVTGYQGSQGITGPQGSQGFQGTQGNQGNQGVTGSQGFQGVAVTGPQGYQGLGGFGVAIMSPTAATVSLLYYTTGVSLMSIQNDSTWPEYNGIVTTEYPTTDSSNQKFISYKNTSFGTIYNRSWIPSDASHDDDFSLQSHTQSLWTIYGTGTLTYGNGLTIVDGNNLDTWLTSTLPLTGDFDISVSFKLPSPNINNTNYFMSLCTISGISVNPNSSQTGMVGGFFGSTTIRAFNGSPSNNIIVSGDIRNANVYRMKRVGSNLSLYMNDILQRTDVVVTSNMYIKLDHQGTSQGIWYNYHWNSIRVWSGWTTGTSKVQTINFVNPGSTATFSNINWSIDGDYQLSIYPVGASGISNDTSIKLLINGNVTGTNYSNAVNYYQQSGTSGVITNYANQVAAIDANKSGYGVYRITVNNGVSMLRGSFVRQLNDNTPQVIESGMLYSTSNITGISIISSNNMATGSKFVLSRTSW